MDGLKTAPGREGVGGFDGSTGIYIRAIGLDGRFGSFDIAELDAPSLLAFLRSRGGDNRWAEDCCGIILGHGHLHLPVLFEIDDDTEGGRDD